MTWVLFSRSQQSKLGQGLDTSVFSLNNADYSLIQDFEADVNSCFYYFSVYLETNDHLNLKLLIFEP